MAVKVVNKVKLLQKGFFCMKWMYIFVVQSKKKYEK